MRKFAMNLLTQPAYIQAHISQSCRRLTPHLSNWILEALSVMKTGKTEHMRLIIILLLCVCYQPTQ